MLLAALVGIKKKGSRFTPQFADDGIFQQDLGSTNLIS